MDKVLKHSPMRTDNVEAMSDALVECLRYADASVDYPTLDRVRPDDGVPAEWFYEAYAGTVPTSELTAILQYTQQRMITAPLGELFLGIALVEMKHYDRLGDLIQHLGGTPTTPAYAGRALEITHEGPAAALEINLRAEQATIAAYERLVGRIAAAHPKRLTPTALAATQLLNKLIADERHHVRLLTEAAAQWPPRDE